MNLFWSRSLSALRSSLLAGLRAHLPTRFRSRLRSLWQSSRHWTRWQQGLSLQNAAFKPASVQPAQPTPAPVPLPVPLRLPLAASATVVIAALNEAEHIASVVAFAWRDPATAEVIVIDDSSTDDTAVLAARAGARVVTSSLLGKGASMHDGVREAGRDIVVFLDGDLSGLREGLISDLCRPLLAGQADFVKARFGRASGRVTELTAKPMLKVFFPELAHFAQPLGGIVAARRALLQQLSFEDGYGVDIGLLIDAARCGARLCEVDIGSLQHDSQPLQDLAAMANEVAHVVYSRARQAGRLHVDQVLATHEAQAQAAASLEYVASRRRGQLRLLLLSLDSCLVSGDGMAELAQASGQAQAHAQVSRGCGQAKQAEQVRRLALLFRFAHRRQLEQAARALRLKPGVVEWVNRMRRCGFLVGVLSDGWFTAAEVLRRRMFADFALAHSLQFEGEVCNGEVRLNPAFQPLPGGTGLALCKSHALRHLRAERGGGPLLSCWAVGSSRDDLALLHAADTAFVIAPQPSGPALGLESDPHLRLVSSFADLLALVPAPQPRQAVTI